MSNTSRSDVAFLRRSCRLLLWTEVFNAGDKCCWQGEHPYARTGPVGYVHAGQRIQQRPGCPRARPLVDCIMYPYTTSATSSPFVHPSVHLSASLFIHYLEASTRPRSRRVFTNLTACDSLRLSTTLIVWPTVSEQKCRRKPDDCQGRPCTLLQSTRTSLSSDFQHLMLSVFDCSRPR